MTLAELKFLILDFQTTGMRPPQGSLLEAAWAVASAKSSEIQIVSHLVAQPEGASVSGRISALTGIQNTDMQNAISREQVRGHLQAEWQPYFLIHYAQFEKPFLVDLLGESAPPVEFICTHQIARRLVPNLPTKGVRGLAGYFGTPIAGELKRAGANVHATWIIWQGIVRELEGLSIFTLPELQDWLRQAKPVKRGKYEYPIERMKRLEMPDQPGVYRMLAKNGTVLYVGKATSLKSRVNSYFRGQKKRDRQKLEMLTQVWDIQVTAVPTPLEAALLETDEIKRLNPPYNISLKARARQLFFYNRNFTSVLNEQDETHIYGPFTSLETIAPLLLLVECLKTQTLAPELFFEPLSDLELILGWDAYRLRQGWSRWPRFAVRDLLAFGFWRLRKVERENVEDEALQEDLLPEPEPNLENKTEPLSPDEVADKFDRLLMRAAKALRRSRVLTQLLNAEIEFEDQAVSRRLMIRGGLVDAGVGSSGENTKSPWAGLDIRTYDRMRVLSTEIERVRREGPLSIQFKRIHENFPTIS